MVEVIRAFYWHQKFVPKGFSALAPGLYTCIKSLKMCIKSDFEEIILKLATYGQTVVIKILSPMNCLPLHEAIYIWWNMKKMYIKLDFKAIFFKAATSGQSDKGFLLTSTFVPKGLSAHALGLYTCIKALKYIPGPGVRWAFTGPLVLWFFPIFKH